MVAQTSASLPSVLRCGTRELSLDRPHIMGILNVTPDSFSDGGALYRQGQLNTHQVLEKARQLIDEGASIIDIGGESTRPGAEPVSIEKELDRVVPAVRAIAEELDVVISVDTSQPQVIAETAAVGAGLINDVRALRIEGALSAAAKARLPVSLMHMQGDPQTMQHNPKYDDCIAQVQDFLAERVQACVDAGIPADQIIVDPGIGFGKRDEHNLELINSLEKFDSIGAGLLFGVSRKSMIGRLLERELSERLPGSLGFALIALQRGANILRVHDVAATADIVKVYELTRINEAEQ